MTDCDLFDLNTPSPFHSPSLFVLMLFRVDGHMRELLHTGYMSNRGRQNVASFLIHNLKIDWRFGARHFEEYLVDHDVSQNWCNWNAAAGLSGGRVNVFNMDKQARDYDPEGEHARYWIPELPSALPGKSVHDLRYTPRGGVLEAGGVSMKQTSLDSWFKSSSLSSSDAGVGSGSSKKHGSHPVHLEKKGDIEKKRKQRKLERDLKMFIENK